ncbi:MAG: ABC transporter substrate-binding protein [Eubacteriales bacterium]|nr:ABC transporter substrate-binding protein [Eubacteriales bacterium]
MKIARISAMLLCVIMILASIPACGDDANTIKVGLIAPLTGNVAVYGNAVKEATELYTKQFNDAGGVNGKKIKLIIYDDKGDPTEAMNAYNKLVNSDKIVALLGPVTSGPTFGVAQESANLNIPGITGTATHPDVTTYGDNYFRACFEDPFQGGAIAEFASDYLKAQSGAIIYNTSDSYSTGLKDSIAAKSKELGLNILATEGYGTDDIDFNAQLTNIIAQNPDVLFIPDYYNNAYLICSQARDAGFEGTFLGVDGTDGVLEIDGADVSVFEGLYFANHYAADDPSEVVQNFITSYKDKYGSTPNALAALGYDAAVILYNAIKAVDTAGTVELGATAESYQAIIDAIAATDMECVTGHITFDPNGNPIKDVSIISITNGAYSMAGKY